ncbi:MAG: hypothetical protein LBL21_02795 [Rickettsiales bacterium]|jgi:hypothetical protein|nr:hypothetical protein [Rickettsiales bacterium]
MPIKQSKSAKNDKTNSSFVWARPMGLALVAMLAFSACAPQDDSGFTKIMDYRFLSKQTIYAEGFYNRINIMNSNLLSLPDDYPRKDEYQVSLNQIRVDLDTALDKFYKTKKRPGSELRDEFVDLMWRLDKLESAFKDMIFYTYLRENEK